MWVWRQGIIRDVVTRARKGETQFYESVGEEISYVF
jgi:hypothetical protein